MAKRTKASFAAGIQATQTPQEQTPQTPDATQKTPTTSRQASRVGKFQVSTFIDSGAAKKQLKTHCVMEDITQEQLVRNALNEYFEKRGKPGIF